MFKTPFIALLFVLLSGGSFAQNRPVLTIEKALEAAYKNNAGINAEQLNLRKYEAALGTAASSEKTQVYIAFDQNNIAENGEPLRIAGISRKFALPMQYAAKSKYLTARYKSAEFYYENQKKRLSEHVLAAYYEYIYLNNLHKLYGELEEIARKFKEDTQAKYQAGNISYAEYLTAVSDFKQIEMKTGQAESGKKQSKLKLQMLTGTDSFAMPEEQLKALPIHTDSAEHPYISYSEQKVKQARYEYQLTRAQSYPEIVTNVFIGTTPAKNSKNYYGFTLGLDIPLWYKDDKAKIQAGKINRQAEEWNLKNSELLYKRKKEQLIAEIELYKKELKYYRENGLETAEEILRAAGQSYKSGEISFSEYSVFYKKASDVKINYLKSLNRYNQTVINYNFLSF